MHRFCHSYLHSTVTLLQIQEKLEIEKNSDCLLSIFNSSNAKANFEKESLGFVFKRLANVVMLELLGIFVNHV